MQVQLGAPQFPPQWISLAKPPPLPLPASGLAGARHSWTFRSVPGTSVPALLLLTDLHGLPASPSPETSAGDRSQEDPTSAWEALCPVGSFQSPATPSLQGLCTASQEAAGNPSLSSRGSVGFVQAHKARGTCPHAHIPCTWLGNPLEGGRGCLTPTLRSTLVVSHPHPTSPSCGRCSAHPVSQGQHLPLTYTKPLFSPAPPRHDPAAKGEYRHF